jgi:hypothetical protein
MITAQEIWPYILACQSKQTRVRNFHFSSFGLGLNERKYPCAHHCMVEQGTSAEIFLVIQQQKLGKRMHKKGFLSVFPQSRRLYIQLPSKISSQKNIILKINNVPSSYSSPIVHLLFQILCETFPCSHG